MFSRCVRERLEANDLCSTPKEYEALSEAIAYLSPSSSAPSDDGAPFPSEDNLIVATGTLAEYFGGFFSMEDAGSLVRDAAFDTWGDAAPRPCVTIAASDDTDDGGGGEDGQAEAVEGDGRLFDDHDDDGDFIGEGECELCERTIKLTRHHLVPKSTWPRMKKRLWNAAPLIESLYRSPSHKQKLDPRMEEEERERSLAKLEKIIGTVDLASFPDTITNDSVRAYLVRVCRLCRQCHSAVHRLHTEWELAMEYNTMERLLECREVVKFGRWASRQRSGRSVR